MWRAYNNNFQSRLLLGTANYPNLDILMKSIDASETEIITTSLRRESGNTDNQFWQSLQKSRKYMLPNTAGCKTADEAVLTAQLAKEVFQTTWIKLEVIGDNYTLQPDVIELVTAATKLIKLGFHVFPYCTDDLIVCQRLIDVGCEVLMPWAAPIGSGQGIINQNNLELLRNRFHNIPLIIDAGIGRPSDACQALEMGFDAVLLNSAIANAIDPVAMAAAFNQAIKSGRQAYKAGIIPKVTFAKQSTPLIDTPFWQQP